MNIYTSPNHRRCGTNEYQPLSDEELFHLTMSVYFEFRVALSDRPDVRLRTEVKQPNPSIVTVIAEWQRGKGLKERHAACAPLLVEVCHHLNEVTATAATMRQQIDLYESLL